MNLDIKGTQSEKNVLEAFSCESQARNRYTYFAKQAKNEGDDKVAELFEAMADNEREHAKVWYKVLHGGLADTLSNMEDAAKREHDEWGEMYPQFAQTAREEGFELLAIMFENIAAIEKNHEAIFLEMLAEKNQAEPRPSQFAGQYRCSSCGYVAQDNIEACPVCGQSGTFGRIDA